MGFAGELATIGLAEVFKNISFNRLSGVLRIAEAGDAAAMYLDEGRIRAFRPGARVFDYETIAERAQAAPPIIIDQARSRPRRQTLKQALVDYADFSEANFDSGLREAVTEEILLLFGKTNASFVFDEQSPDPGYFDAEQLDCRISIDPEELAAEATRRKDEWYTIGAVIGSESEIFVTNREAATGDIAPEAAALMEQLDGTQELRSVIEQAPMERIKSLRIVSELLESGAVLRASASELRELAKEAEQHGEINRSASLLRAAIEREPDNLELRQDLAALFREASRFSDAAQAYKELAAVQEERGDVMGSIRSYTDASELMPHDIETLERIVALHDARGDMRARLNAGKKLAAAHSAQGRHAPALVVLQDLLSRDPQNIPLREAIATTYIKMHEPHNAAQELMSLAESASAANGYHKALHYYRSVLAVDRSCSAAALRIEELESTRLRERRRARRRRFATAMIAIVVGLGFWQGARELLAQDAISQLGRVAPWRDRAQAASGYADVCADFPWTRGAVHAEEMVRALLLDELHELRRLAVELPAAVEPRLRRFGRIDYPDAVRELWHEGRHDVLNRATRHAQAGR